MPTLEVRLTAEAQARLDDHLDRIDQVLRRQKMARRERLSVCDDVESQVLDMLARSEREQVSAADLSDVLRTLDPPESFGSDAVPAVADTPAVRRPPPAHLAELSALLAFVVGIVSTTCLIADPSEEWVVLGTTILVLTAIISGWMSYKALGSTSTRRLSKMKRWLALFGLMFLPLLILSAAPQILLDPVLENVFYLRLVIQEPYNTRLLWPFRSFHGVGLALSALAAVVSAATVSFLVSRVMNSSPRFRAH